MPEKQQLQNIYRGIYSETIFYSAGWRVRGAGAGRGQGGILKCVLILSGRRGHTRAARLLSGDGVSKYCVDIV